MAGGGNTFVRLHVHNYTHNSDPGFSVLLRKRGGWGQALLLPSPLKIASPHNQPLPLPPLTFSSGLVCSDPRFKEASNLLGVRKRE